MNKTIKKLFAISLIIFVLISLHLGYMYVNYFGDSKIIKWWTIVEWTTQKINYLPYTSFTKADRFYQWLLFDKCIKVSWVDWTDGICTVTTKDYKEFTVKLNTWYSWLWSDGEPVTIDDIYFTYSDIIKSNVFQIQDLSIYNNLDVYKPLDDVIKIKFPAASIDNQLFFDNFILPQHALTGKDLAYYQTEFANNIIKNSCWEIKKDNIDNNSLIFNLSGCVDLNKQFYQIKKFSSIESLNEEMDKLNSLVDFASYSELSDQISGYDVYNHPNNKFLIMFMNVNNVSSDIRKNMYKFVKNIDVLWIDKYDNSVFNADAKWQNLKAALANTWWTTANVAATNTVKLPILTKSIYIYGINKYKSYQIDKIADTFPINLKFDKSYAKVAIAANWWWRYIPASYNSWLRSTDYNLSFKFNNLKNWTNYYTVWWYEESDPETPIKLLTITLKYGSNTTVNQVTTTKKDKFKIIYINSNFINKYISWLQSAFVNEWIDSFFTWEWFSWVSELNGKINNNDYDFVLNVYDFGSKYDLSMFFGSNSIVNPSNYKNPTIQQNISEYFLWTKKLKEDIQKVYQNELPFVILARDSNDIYIKNDAPISGMNHTWMNEENRRTTLMNIYKPTKKPIIDESIIDINKLKKFIIDNIKS